MKYIFQDLMRVKQPRKLWKFFLISIFIHIGVIYVLTMLRFNPLQPIPRIPQRISSTTASPPSLRAERPAKPVDKTTQPVEEAYEGFEVPDEPVDLTDENVKNREINEEVTEDKALEAAILAGENRVEISSPYMYMTRRRNIDVVDTDEYIKLYRKPFQYPQERPTSTFSLKIGTLSYPRVRRAIKRRQLPEVDEVKIEEMINYFYYDYPQPTGEHPISITTELAACPWNPSTRLLHIGLSGKIVFGDGLKDSQFTIARDVKIRVTFNPDKVMAYRLIGYGSQTPKVGQWSHESRESGEMRAGQRITSLYEMIPMPSTSDKKTEDRETAIVMVSYKDPDTLISKQISHPVWEKKDNNQKPSENFRFSAAVAQFGMLLKNPELKGKSSLAKLLELAKDAIGEDRYGHRAMFIKLLEMYHSMMKEKKKK
jgi:hypothetical protein